MKAWLLGVICGITLVGILAYKFNVVKITRGNGSTVFDIATHRD